MSKLSRRSSTFIFGYILLSAALVLGACHGKKSKKGSTDGDTPCTTTAACIGTQICDPGTSKCVDTLACTTHDQCGTAAYCDTAAGQCVKSVAGQANPCGEAANCAGTELCAAGHCGCGGTAYESTKVIPNLLITLDRSMSMLDEINGQTKRSMALAAVESLTTDPSFQDQIRFGLALYPGTELTECSDPTNIPGGLIVPPSADASAIMTALNKSKNCSGTPIGGTLNALRTTYASQWQDPARPNNILLITDGAENQNEDENDPLYPVTQADLFYTQTPPVKTYVIGFQAASGCNDKECINPDMLNAIASKGGTGSFQPATDLDSLKLAFKTIAGSALSCTYSLGTTPPNADKLYVFQTKDGVDAQVSRDSTNGWDYDATNNQVEFHGAACTVLQDSASVTDVSIVYGCPAGSMGG